jgi:hypothetical protein
MILGEAVRVRAWCMAMASMLIFGAGCPRKDNPLWGLTGSATQSGSGNGSSSAGTTSAATSSASGSTATPTSSSASNTAGGSATSAANTTTGIVGGCPADGQLADDPLVRYWIDEIDPGTFPEQLVDRASTPLNLDLVDNGALELVERPTGQGLRWTVLDSDSVGRVAVGNTKLNDLNTAAAATVEIVVEREEVSSSASKLLHFGDFTSEGFFTLESDSSTQIAFTMDDGQASWTWPVIPDGGRVVFHLVWDPQGGSGEVRLYRNATLLTTGAGPGTVPSSPGLRSTHQLSLGNRPNGGNSLVGTIFYAAIYTRKLTAAEIAIDSGVLLACDDR